MTGRFNSTALSAEDQNLEPQRHKFVLLSNSSGSSLFEFLFCPPYYHLLRYIQHMKIPFQYLIHYSHNNLKLKSETQDVFNTFFCLRLIFHIEISYQGYHYDMGFSFFNSDTIMLTNSKHC